MSSRVEWASSPLVVAALRCPYCHQPLSVERSEAGEETFSCAKRHAFDRSRAGYLTLLGKRAQQKTADTLDMAQRRQRFLDRGYYERFAREVAEMLAAHLPNRIDPLLGDLGAGTGYYSRALIETMPQSTVLALDLSKRALTRAKAPGVYRIVADIWEDMPLRDHALDGAINVFAPRNGAEFARVLKSGAPLVVATPTQRHMLEVRSAADLIKIGRQDSTKKRDVDRKLEPYFRYESTHLTEYALTLEREDVEDLVMMGPNAFHTRLEDLRATLASLEAPFTVTMSVESRLYFSR